MSSDEWHELMQRAACQVGVDRYVQKDMNVGIGGSGSMTVFVIEYLAQKLETGELKNITAIPASDIAAKECALNGIPLKSYADVAEIHVGFDQVDELDTRDMSFILGRSTVPVQPQLMRSRIMIEKAKVFCALVPEGGVAKGRLGGALPVVIEEGDWEATGEEIDDIFLGDAEVRFITNKINLFNKFIHNIHIYILRALNFLNNITY